MYNNTEIQNNLLGLVGWRQNVDASGWQLTEMTTSETGLYFNDVSPLLTFDNLISICPRFDLQSNGQPVINGLFTEWLKQKTTASITKAVNAWIDSKTALRTASSLLDRDLLFKATGRFEDLEAVGTKRVGMEIKPKRSKNLLVKIRKLSIQLNTAQTLEVRLFENGNPQAIQMLTANYTTAKTVQWFETNWDLKGNKTYWIEYKQTDLTGQAINGVYDYSINRETIFFPSSKYFKVSSFSVDDSGTTLWDVSKNQYTPSTNYGINLDYSVSCDYTDFIIEQKSLFKTIIWYQVAIDLLREIAINPNSRINRNESNVSMQSVLYELDGDSQGRATYSLQRQYADALKTIQLDTGQIDNVCLTCKKRGVRFTST